MVKYLNLAVVMLLALLASCNHNDEPPLEANLSVAEQYMPANTVFNADDKEFLDKVKGYADKTMVINSLAELNDDPFGFSDAYKGIDFDEYTLLVAYWLHDMKIDTFRNRYYRDTKEKTYNWAIHIGTSTPPDESPEQLEFTRFAILVKKLPADADIRIWKSIGALNWDWE